MISIIIPLYNQAKFIEETLKTVLGQTSNLWECIIVNDGSTDSSENVVLKWIKKDARFSYFYQENNGVSSARNFGIYKAKYGIIFPLDSDDLIAEDLVEHVLEVFANTEADVVHFNSAFFGAKTGINNLPEYNYKTLLLQNTFIVCTPFKKEAFFKCGGYDEQLVSFEDWDLWIRMLNTSNTVHKINKTLYHYRKHERGSLTNKFSENPKLYFELYDYIYLKNKAIYDKHFKNPILAYQENELLIAFNNKIKKTFLFRAYVKLKKVL